MGRSRRRRSVAESEQLVEAVTYFLVALCRYLDAPKGIVSAPEHQNCKSADFVDAFRAAYMHELKAGRYRVLQRAADLAMGEGAADWFRTLRLEGEDARVIGSDAALLKRLRELAGVYQARRDLRERNGCRRATHRAVPLRSLVTRHQSNRLIGVCLLELARKAVTAEWRQKQIA